MFLENVFLGSLKSWWGSGRRDRVKKRRKGGKKEKKKMKGKGKEGVEKE